MRGACLRRHVPSGREKVPERPGVITRSRSCVEWLSTARQRYELFSVLGLADWAEAVGMDRGAFRRAMADPANRRELVEMKKEGIVNNIEATPTFFVNDRKYLAELNSEEVIDVLEEEFDRIKGVRYRE